MALNSLFYADVPLRNYSLAHLWTCWTNHIMVRQYVVWICLNLVAGRIQILTNFSYTVASIPLPGRCSLRPVKNREEK